MPRSNSLARSMPSTILQMHEARCLVRLDRTSPDDGETNRCGSEVAATSPHDAMFVPPRHETVPAAIEDLIGFIDRDDLPVLAQAALAHAQFETIHPFPDGNGRTGRALIHAELRNKRLTRNVTVPVSAGLLVDTDAYFEALTAYRLGDTAPIVEQLAAAAFAAVGKRPPARRRAALGASGLDRHGLGPPRLEHLANRGPSPPSSSCERQTHRNGDRNRYSEHVSGADAARRCGCCGRVLGQEAQPDVAEPGGSRRARCIRRTSWTPEPSVWLTRRQASARPIR